MMTSEDSYHPTTIDISEDTFNALNSLDSHKSVGIDGTGPKFLKNCASFLYRPLHYLFKPFTLQTCYPTRMVYILTSQIHYVLLFKVCGD